MTGIFLAGGGAFAAGEAFAADAGFAAGVAQPAIPSSIATAKPSGSAAASPAPRILPPCPLTRPVRFDACIVRHLSFRDLDITHSILNPARRVKSRVAARAPWRWYRREFAVQSARLACKRKNMRFGQDESAHLQDGSFPQHNKMNKGAP
jgi:hypothetical protein